MAPKSIVLGDVIKKLDMCLESKDSLNKHLSKIMNMQTAKRPATHSHTHNMYFQR